MPTDRLLNTVLGAYQRIHDDEQTKRLLSSTTSLLTTLSNPLNITVLTSQLLTAPAIWTENASLATSFRIISIYNTAAITVRQHEIDIRTGQPARQGGGVQCDEWAKAVVKGLDDRSSRWQHLLVLAGVLIGMEGQGREGLSRSLRSTLEGAMVTAANLALLVPAKDGILGAESIVLALNHAFPFLSDTVVCGLNFDALAPLIMRSITGPSGYQEGFFLGVIDGDVRQNGGRLEWSRKSPSFLQFQELGTKPIISSMGPLSRLLAHSIENLSDSRIVVSILDDMEAFSAMLLNQWKRNRLSGIDPSEEELVLRPETRRVTVAALWQTLKTAMFASVVALRAILGRTLIDPRLSSDAIAPTIASKALHTLRHLYFVTSRIASNALTAYTFVSLASIDILSRYPVNTKIFLTQIQPSNSGQIPTHALERILDLYYLNTCEHFPLVLSAEDTETLIIGPASPYLNASTNKALLEIFEAAHSATLAALSAPQNAPLASKVIPFYTEALFTSFPMNLSPRQFRFAFKTLLQITTPPSPLSLSQPNLPDILVELLHHRTLHAPTTPLPPALTLKSDADANQKESGMALSEQAVLMLTLLDALPFLPISSLSDWLPLAADLLNTIEDKGMKEVVKRRFWEVCESGEMDIDRAGVTVAWWTSRGGREAVLYGREAMEHGGGQGPFMSGGLGSDSKDSKL